MLQNGRRKTIAQVSLLALAAALASGTAAHAVEADVPGGQIRIDTTIQFGAQFRVEERDDDLVAIGNGGNSPSNNGDEGDLNYDEGLVSALARITPEIEYRGEWFDAFVRFTAFYDFYNADGDNTEFKDLSDRAIRQVGKDVRLLDAFVQKTFDVGGTDVSVRAGNQVLSWGESTFIPNGINTINPIDVATLLTPGSELKEALLPIPAVDVRVGLTSNLSVEGFYQFLWEETEIPPAGTYFSTNDFITGGNTAYLSPGDLSEDGLDYENLTSVQIGGGITDPVTGRVVGATHSFGYAIPRSRTDDGEPDDGGQWGLALRYFAEELNQTEFGLYYINYHSRLPVISGQTGSTAFALGGQNYAGTASYIIEYPEDIQLFGASFNTKVGGIALQGEVSYRLDQPIQLDDYELLQASLYPAIVAACAGGAGSAAACSAQEYLEVGTIAGGAIDVPGDGTALIDDLGNVGFGSKVDGYREFDVLQAQFTATNNFGRVSFLDQLVGVLEVGVTHVIDFADSDLVFEGPNTDQAQQADSSQLVVFGPFGGTDSGTIVGFEDHDSLPDETSMGYRLRLAGEIQNALGPITLLPSFAFSHDPWGTTPLPLGNFIEDRASINLTLNARYLENYEIGIGYTNFFAIGDDEYNALRDRDFVSVTGKVQF